MIAGNGLTYLKMCVSSVPGQENKLSKKNLFHCSDNRTSSELKLPIDIEYYIFSDTFVASGQDFLLAGVGSDL